MSTSTDERNRILAMIESGQLTAEQAANLLDALVVERRHADERTRNHTVRIRMTDLTASRQKFSIAATLPVSLVSGILGVLTRLIPQSNERTLEDVIWAIESGATGRLLDLQDLEEGKRFEIFVE